MALTRCKKTSSYPVDFKLIPGHRKIAEIVGSFSRHLPEADLRLLLSLSTADDVARNQDPVKVCLYEASEATTLPDLRERAQKSGRRLLTPREMALVLERQSLQQGNLLDPAFAHLLDGITRTAYVTVDEPEWRVRLAPDATIPGPNDPIRLPEGALTHKIIVLTAPAYKHST